MRRALLEEQVLSQLQEQAAGMGLPFRVHVNLVGEASLHVNGERFDDAELCVAHLERLARLETEA